jgi:hypothetical protein
MKLIAFLEAGLRCRGRLIQVAGVAKAEGKQDLWSPLKPLKLVLLLVSYCSISPTASDPYISNQPFIHPIDP